MNPPAPEGIRLNKYLASAGVGSRRGCDALVQQGEVIINGEVCLTPGYRVQPGDFIRVGSKRIEPLEVQSIVMHKPPGLVCTRHDENNRATIYERYKDAKFFRALRASKLYNAYRLFRPSM